MSKELNTQQISKCPYGHEAGVESDGENAWQVVCYHRADENFRVNACWAGPIRENPEEAIAEWNRMCLSMKSRSLPGITAKHTIITPTCRLNPAGGGAFERAIAIIRPEYEKIVSIRNDDFRAHIILTIEKD